MRFESLDQVEEALHLKQGVMTIDMLSLRDAYGAARLGVNVRANLSNKLAARGIRHMPGELPDNQSSAVRLYQVGSPAGKLIDAVRKYGEEKDAIIREAATSDASVILEKVRELVCE